MHCPVLVTISVRLLPHSRGNHCKTPFHAAHGTPGAALHEWPPCSHHTHVISEQPQISYKVDTERPLQPQQNICGTLLRQPLRSGVALRDTGNLACMHKKPGQNTNPAECIHEVNEKIPKEIDQAKQKACLMSPWIRSYFEEKLTWRRRRMGQRVGVCHATLLVLRLMLFQRQFQKSSESGWGGGRALCALCCLQAQVLTHGSVEKL